MITKPFISIIIPVYNVALYIERCLTSCINQSFSDIEIIVIDDKGSDNSIALVQSYATQDTRIKILDNQVNKGVFHSRQQGTLSALGDYILYVDGDDFLDKDCCQFLYEQVKHQPDIDLFHFAGESYPQSNGLIYSGSEKSCQNSEIMSDIFSHSSHLIWTMWGKLIKTTVAQNTFTQLPFIEQRIICSEDLLFLFALSMNAKNSQGSLKKPYYFYFNNVNSMTRETAENKIQARISSNKKVIDYLNQINNPSFDQNILAKYRKKMTALLYYYIHFDARQLKGQYFASMLACLRYYPRIKNVVRLLLFIVSLGKIKK